MATHFEMLIFAKTDLAHVISLITATVNCIVLYCKVNLIFCE